MTMKSQQPDEPKMAEHVQNLAWNCGLFDWISSAGPAQIAASKADSTRRPIGITAFVEDPRARTMHAWIILPSKTEYQVNVDGEAVDVWINGTSDRQLNSVLLGTFALSALEACQRCLALLLSLLSSWSFQTQRPIALREIAVEDKTHSAKWLVRPQAQEPLKLNDITVSLGAPNPIGSLLALFREGMASVQPAYKFLCYYKIIEAWKEAIGPFKHVNKLFYDRGQVPARRVLRFQLAMFDGKCELDKYEHLIGKKFGSCFDQMNAARKFLAHPFDTKGTFVSFDDPKSLQALSDLANIAERMVIEILAEEIRVIRLLGATITGERVIAGYVHESWGRDLLEKT